MSLQPINVVWMKRDIRSQDHQPLFVAEKHDLAYLILYVFDTDVIHYPDTDLRHLRFQYHSLKDLKRILNISQNTVCITYGPTISVFEKLNSLFQIQNIYSYQESGIPLTYDIDKQVSRFCKKHKIHWQEFQRDGIIRGIKNREGWDKNWYITMHQPIIHNTFTPKKTLDGGIFFEIPEDIKQEWENYPKNHQPAGASQAFKYLHTFLKERHYLYSKHISKPLDSRTSCGRLSPYLAWGNISIKQVYQAAKQHSSITPYKRPLANFITRLKWHCHFIQKFETACEYEKICINKGFESLKYNKNDIYLRTWKNGQTGYPLVDACMRCLIHTGWINFRMRALLVSFLTHHLFQNWKDGVYYLAQQFLDYEPGIHYTQFQMQAGVTGVNTLRVYNPTKNAQEHDTEAVFIKKWCPELQNLPPHFAIQPWTMTQMDETFYNFKIGFDYPNPIVSLEESKKNISLLWDMRKDSEVKNANRQILATLVRPHSQTARLNSIKKQP